jgi:hypothetical protein
MVDLFDLLLRTRVPSVPDEARVFHIPDSVLQLRAASGDPPG